MATEVAREAKSKARKPPRAERQLGPSGPVAAQSPRAARSGSYKRPSPVRARSAEHVVFLVPGLLGFENFSTFTYFADRVVAALRAGLEQTWLGPVPVVAVPIPPTASLRERQTRLVKTLADRLHAIESNRPGGKPLCVHLVGHSTGGLDANLLTSERPLQPPLHERPNGTYTWADVDPRAPALRDRIRSVISIGSPHQGACIARDPLARLLRDRDLSGLPDWFGVLGKFTASVLSDFELHTLVSSVLREGAKTTRFANSLLRRWDLLDDLQPSRDPRETGSKRDVLRRSFVTVAGQPVLGETRTPLEDSFFRDLSRRASGWGTGAAEEGPLVQASVARLRRALVSEASDLVICGHGVELPQPLDAGHNDGVVNSARQLMDPNDPDELAGIVVSDHFDVIGYYDRHVFTLDESGHEQATQVLSGLLHSGSGFRDDQFFELYRRVAGVIVESFR
jgi:pimeloyl-ACP methyl ester carboxylesterase